MAEKKYDLALIDTKNDQPVKHQKWYKERLQTKYIKNLKPGEKITTSNTKDWIFLKDGLDDFRDGLPPDSNGCDFIKIGKGDFPIISSDFLSCNSGGLKKPGTKKRLSRFQTYLSKNTPQQYQRRAFVEEVEQGLLKHPLALYPHLEESVAPEIFEDIVDLLDPQFNINEIQDDDIEGLGKLDEHLEDGSFPEADQSVRPKPDDLGFKDGDTLATKNLYRWVPRKESKKDGKKTKESEIPWSNTIAEEEHMKRVTQEFCEWVQDLGGETNNIEESTITSLFASGYETKPALSVPIHVVELTNVPQELRVSAVVPPPAPTSKTHLANFEAPKKKISSDYEPSWVKFRYGAWYLHPKTWKKMGYTEPLEDPKQLKEYELSEAKKRSNELNHELAGMHASKAFSEFIPRKNTRKPEFLVEVSEIQKKAAEEEQRRLELEQQSKQKKRMSLKEVVEA
ncbi:protein FAM47E-like [Physella acuta]|uniref:protein FAM47E-like n=1 Tax=Physella acuta TaxID=109671 RepID=UPI0027DD9549|nr:protein FAM47E-like [Physella acuta]